MSASLKRDLFFAYRTAKSQSTSFLHRDKPSGIRYEGEADGLLAAIRMLNAHQTREWEAHRAEREADSA